MVREPRKFKKGGIYHLIKRSIGPQKIFKDKQDYSRCSLELEFCNSKKYVDLWEIVAENAKGGTLPPLAERVKEARQEKGKPLVKLLAFVLMPTHIHLLAQEIVEGGISKYMRKLGGYSTYFNKRYNRNGPLFQRYKLVPIKTDEQLQIAFAYVHTNPIELWESNWKQYQVENKEEALKKLENYFWSSYVTYIGKDRFLNTVDRDFFLNLFGSEEKCRQVVKDWIDYKAGEKNIKRSKFE